MLKHPFVLTLLPILCGSISYLYIDFKNSCPEIKEISLKRLKDAEKISFNAALLPGESKVYIKNKSLFNQYLLSENYDEYAKIEEKILMQYFVDSNEDIFQYMEDIKNKYIDKKRFVGVSYLYGNAGVGKSFVKNSITHIGKENICNIPLNKCIRPGRNFGAEIVDTPQLYSKDFFFSKLPSFDKFGLFSIKELLKQHNCLSDKGGSVYPVIIFDDLDEIHPDASKLLLESIDDFIAGIKNKQKFLHVVIFGRPEAFTLWRSSSHYKYPENFFEAEIRGPQYTHESDLKVLSMSFFVFAKHSKYPESFPEKLTNYVKLHPFLMHTIDNLSNGNLVIKRMIDNPSSEDSDSLKQKLLDDFFARNSGTHGRPERFFEKGVLYENLLQDIAAKYTDKINSEGYFEVDVKEQMKLIKDSEKQHIDILQNINKCNSEYLTFNIQSTLEYSGIISMIPINDKIKKYRFQPFWIHELLLKERLKRLANQH